MNINDYYIVKFPKNTDIVVRIATNINPVLAKCFVVVGNNVLKSGEYHNICFCSDCKRYLITDKDLIHKYNKELIFG